MFPFTIRLSATGNIRIASIIKFILANIAIVIPVAILPDGLVYGEINICYSKKLIIPLILFMNSNILFAVLNE